MDNMHPLMAQALAPFAPPSLNDDDFYIINLRTRTVVREYGASSPAAQQARTQGIPVLPGHALVSGMAARHLGLLS